MKTCQHILSLVILISTTCFSQADTSRVLSFSSDTVRLHQAQYQNPMLRTPTISQKGLLVDDFVITLNTEGQKGKDIETLSHLLTDSFETDSLKVRAIFFWMTQNIAYDTKQYHDHITEKFYCRKNEKYTHAVERWEWERARNTLIKRKGICADYALLFKYLCGFAGVESIVVDGYAATSKQISPYLGEKAINHAWNAVWIDDKPYLMDVTWASGYCDNGVKKFTREINERYYLTPPEEMILNHHPKDTKWQFLKCHVRMKDFVARYNGCK